MKYIKSISEFKSYNESNIRKVPYSREIKVYENAFENDITWGGSLLGRLINSTIRYSTAQYKSTKIKGIVAKVQTCLDTLVANVALDEDSNNSIDKLKVKMLLKEIYTVVSSDSELDEKLTTLLGDKTQGSGLIDTTISYIESIDIDKKDILIKKLEDFKKALMDIDYNIKDEDDEDDEDTNDVDQSNPEFKFFTTNINLFKSIIGLNNVIKNRRIKIEGEQDIDSGYRTDDTSVGDINAYYRNQRNISKNKKVDNKQTTTTKPITTTQTKKPPFKITSIGSKEEREAVEAMNLINNENVETLGSKEKHAIAAWKKIIKVCKDIKIDDLSKKLEEIINQSKSGEKLNKTVVIAIGKNIILNEATTGKPIGYQELIKEEMGNIPSQYSDLPKRISFLSKILLSFKDDMGLIGSLGEAIQHIKNYIKSYNELKNIYPKLSNKKLEKFNDFNFKKNLEKFNDFNFLNEKFDINDDSTYDKVQVAWFKFFNKGEENAWKLTNEDSELRDKVENIGDKEIPFDSESHVDKIMEIVNLFGKAYRLYANSSIPSGRPGGRISQKTFRAYIYIGEQSSGRGGDWENGVASGGPWAYKITFEKWEDGITKILEDPKYRKVLANIKFKNTGPNQDQGSGVTGKDGGYGSDGGSPNRKIVSGRSLFDFINEMINPEGGFAKSRQKIMKEYFGGVDKLTSAEEEARKKEERESKENLQEPKTKEVGDEKVISFVSADRNGLYKVDNISKLIGNFIKIKYKDNHIIAYVIGKKEINKIEHLLIKFNFSSSGEKQNLISKYLSNDLKDKYKITEESKIIEENTPLYFGVIPVSQKILKNKDLKFKYGKVTNNNLISEIKLLDIKKIEEITFLAHCPYQDKVIWKLVEVKTPQSRLQYDISDIDKIDLTKLI